MSDSHPLFLLGSGLSAVADSDLTFKRRTSPVHQQHLPAQEYFPSETSPLTGRRQRATASWSITAQLSMLILQHTYLETHQQKKKTASRPFVKNNLFWLRAAFLCFRTLSVNLLKEYILDH